MSNDEPVPDGNTVTVGNEESSIRMAVDNKGLDSHEFTLEAEWPTGSYATKASTGILDEACKQLIDVPLGPGAFTAC